METCVELLSKLKLELLCAPAVAGLGRYSQGLSASQHATLFTTAEPWNWPR